MTSSDRLIIRPLDGPHRLLTVTWVPCHDPVVTPQWVPACVGESLRRGWLSEWKELELQGAEVNLRSQGSA
jgi:hypothetical protein